MTLTTQWVRIGLPEMCSKIYKMYVPSHYKKPLEIPASQVFLGADAQLLGTSQVGAIMP